MLSEVTRERIYQGCWLISGHCEAEARQLDLSVNCADRVWGDPQEFSVELHAEAPTDVDAMGYRLRLCM